MIVVYIAGPISARTGHKVEENLRRAEAMAFELAQLGFAPICVHSFERFHQGVFSAAEWMEIDLEILSRCDACFMVEGWGTSKGSIKENNWCHENGYPVFYDIKTLETWAETFEEESCYYPHYSQRKCKQPRT